MNTSGTFLRTESHSLPSMSSLPTMGTARPDAPASSGDPLGRIDQYEVLRKLGGGGFGVVYLARDTASGIDVALKTLHPALKHDAEELDRLRSKFALVARLAHPNIATALVLHPAREIDIPDEEVRRELRLAPGDPVMVMRYAPGVTLTRWRLQFPEGIAPPAQAIDILRQIAAALDCAHAERIVHRDVKPSNVMVETLGGAPSGGTSRPGEPPRLGGDASPQPCRVRARVLDFGLAAEIRSSMSRVSTETGDTSGTRPYMAPEQWLGRRQDGRTDQYALACLAYELLSGAPPFAGVFETGDPAIMLMAVERRAPEPVEGLSPRANAVFARALAKDGEARYPDCTAFVTALERALSAAPIRGASPSPRALRVGAIGAIAAAVGIGWLFLRPHAPESPRASTLGASSTRGAGSAPEPPHSSTPPHSSVPGAVAPGSPAAVEPADLAEALRRAKEEVRGHREFARLVAEETAPYAKWRDAAYADHLGTIADAQKRLEASGFSPAELARAREDRERLETARRWIVGNAVAREEADGASTALDSRLAAVQKAGLEAVLSPEETAEVGKERTAAGRLLDAGEFAKARDGFAAAAAALGRAATAASNRIARLRSARAAAAALRKDAGDTAEWADEAWGRHAGLLARSLEAVATAEATPESLESAERQLETASSEARWLRDHRAERADAAKRSASLDALVKDLPRDVPQLAAEAYQGAEALRREAADALQAGDDIPKAVDALDRATGAYGQARDKAERARTDIARVRLCQDAARKTAGEVESAAYPWTDAAFVARIGNIRRTAADIAALPAEPAARSKAETLFRSLQDDCAWVADNRDIRSRLDADERAYARLLAEAGEDGADAAQFFRDILREGTADADEAAKLRERGDYREARNRLARAAGFLEEAVSQTKEMRSAKAVALAKSYRDADQWSACLDSARLALKWDPSNADARHLRDEAAAMLRPTKGQRRSIALRDRRDPAGKTSVELSFQWVETDKEYSGTGHWRTTTAVLQDQWLAVSESSSWNFFPKGGSHPVNNVNGTDVSQWIATLSARPECRGWTFSPEWKNAPESGVSLNSRTKDNTFFLRGTWKEAKP